MFILLDYDDTLAHTEKTALTAACALTNEVLAELSLPPCDREEFLEKYPGSNYRKIITDVLSQHGATLDTQRLDQLVVEERIRVIDAFRAGLEPIAGTEQALNTLNQKKHTLAVVSSSHGERLVVCLEATKQHTLIPSEHVFSAQSSLPEPKPKPAPDIWHFAMQKLGATPQNTIPVEDSPTGVRSAVAAGLTVVGSIAVTDPVKRNEHALRLFDAGARWVIDHMDLLPMIVSRIENGNTDILDSCFGRSAYLPENLAA